MNFKNLEKDKWTSLVDKVLDEEIKTEIPVQFFGSDIDRKTVFLAKQNAKNAGVDDLIQFKTETVATVKGTTENLGAKGYLITNPPYGSRIGEWDNLRDVYRDLAHTLKTEFKNWTAWILSGNKDLIGDLKLKSSQRVFVYNGPIECRFLKYEMF
jgi:putative N6-adenine-specific DNA methylase